MSTSLYNCGCTPQAPACNCPPSPIPPWARTTQSPLVQTVSDATVTTLLLDPDITYLSASQVSGTPITFNLILPNGNYLKQMKRIYVPTAFIATTATFIVSGTFGGGFTSLTFNTVGFSALLEWDGTGWQMIGGNALFIPT